MISSRVFALLAPCSPGLVDIGTVDIVEVAIDIIVGGVAVLDVLAGEGSPEPAPFDVCHVPDQPEQVRLDGSADRMRS